MMITIVFILGITNVLGWGEWCSTSIDRLNEGPDDFTDIIAKKIKYEDRSFNGNSMLYWPFLIGETKSFNFNIYLASTDIFLHFIGFAIAFTARYFIIFFLSVI